jgi:hypothetical protein
MVPAGGRQAGGGVTQRVMGVPQLDTRRAAFHQLQGAPVGLLGQRQVDLGGMLGAVGQHHDVIGQHLHLSLVTPDDAGGYRKRVLVRGARPVQDLRALRVGGELVVAFRRARELRLLQAQLGTRGEVRLQSGGSW